MTRERKKYSQDQNEVFHPNTKYTRIYAVQKRQERRRKRKIKGRKQQQQQQQH
jgi:hypothetical protein